MRGRGSTRAAPALAPLVPAGRGLGYKQELTEWNQKRVDRGPDGSRTESKTDVKEQHLFRQKGNAHLQTTSVRRNEAVLKKKNGRVVVEETITIRKTSYL